MTAARWLAAGALGLAAGAAGAQQAPVPAGVVLRPATFEVSGVARSVDEGRFDVPANRTSGSAVTLTLGFVRFRSTAEAPGAPIVFLAGGPGDAATRALRGIPAAFLDDLLAIADVIAFDQRGTGTSEPRNPTCAPGAALPRDRPADTTLMLEVLRAQVTACLMEAARTGVDPMGLTTAESADDLEALRVALGVPRLSLLAGSYGTHLALATVRRHPALVERMVLAGVEGPDDTFKLPSRTDSVLQAIAAARRPSLPGDIRTLRARMAAEPARHTFPAGQVIVLGEWDLQRWIAESLDTVREIDAMLATVPAMLDGDFSTLGPWALRSRMPRPLNLMNLAMDCASYGSAERLARIRREAPTALLGDAMDFPRPALCDVPGLPRLADDFRAPLTSDVRALLVAGTFDGRTPPPNAEAVARRLPSARLLVIDGASHGLFAERAVLEAMLAFFRQ